MEYIFKVSAVIAIFYSFYKLFLQRDTFFKENRWFLLLGLISAFLVPFLVIKDYVAYTPVVIDPHAFGEIVANNNVNRFNIVNYLPFIYLMGIAVFCLRFLIQIASIFSLIHTNKKHKEGFYTYVETNTNVSPFSFFNWIVYNPNQFNKTELEQIIIHEKAHAKQYHSIDVLLTQIIGIILWFNPFIWLYNKALKQNLEFLADRAAIHFSNCKKSYQYTLLKTSLPSHQMALSNPFYNSLIKKRIVMLHKSKSKKINQIKFALVIPLLGFFLMGFNTKTVYIEKEIPVNDLLVTEIPLEVINIPEFDNSIYKTSKISKKQIKTPLNSNFGKHANNTSQKKNMVEAIVTKKTTNAELDKIVSMLKEHGVTVKFKGIKRNGNSEITAIKIDANTKNSEANFNLDSEYAIKPIKISYSKEQDSLSIGNTFNKHKLYSYTFSSDDGEVYKIRTSGNSKNAVFIAADDEVQEIETDTLHVVTSNNETKDIKIIKNKNIEILSDDEKTIELTFENDDDADENNEDIVIIKKGKSNDSLNKVYKLKKSVVKIEDDSNISISTDGNKNPLFIIDGKETSKEDINDINPDTIETVNVFKGIMATKKYGNKAKDGVVEITTKKKD